MATELNFLKVSAETEDTVAVLTIDRPDAANAFNPEIIHGILSDLQTVNDNSTCRALVLRGRGKHFSAGADLAWMKSSADLSYGENVEDAHQLIALFNAFENLRLPTVCAIRGAVFGGAVGLVACSDIAIATEKAKFCLSEVKLGLLPAVILPHVARKFAPGQLRRHSLSGRVFTAQEALSYGLVERVVAEDELETAVREELNHLLQCSSEAQERLKALHKRIVADSLKQGEHTAQAIAEARTSKTGQAGLSSFFAKKPAPWVQQLADNWTWND